MNEDQKTIKTFTLEEANGLVPVISVRMDAIFLLGQKIKNLARDIEDLYSIWGKDIQEITNVDNAFYIEKVSAREDAMKQLSAEIGEINHIGCVVKDPDNGLVDFYHDNKGEIVFLCWRYGERQIDHWHTLEGGFRTRQHISTLK